MYGVSADQLGVRSFDLQPSRLLLAAQAHEKSVDTNGTNLRTSFAAAGVGPGGGAGVGAGVGAGGGAEGAHAPLGPGTPTRSRASTADDMASFSSDVGVEDDIRERRMPSRWEAVKSNMQVQY